MDSREHHNVSFDGVLLTILIIFLLAGLILVSYSYFEKDAIQQANADFFIKIGMGIDSMFMRDKQSGFVIVINGDECG